MHSPFTYIVLPMYTLQGDTYVRLLISTYYDFAKLQIVCRESFTSAVVLDICNRLCSNIPPWVVLLHIGVRNTTNTQ